jgi:hypothetical protein
MEDGSGRSWAAFGVKPHIKDGAEMAWWARRGAPPPEQVARGHNCASWVRMNKYAAMAGPDVRVLNSCGPRSSTDHVGNGNRAVGDTTLTLGAASGAAGAVAVGEDGAEAARVVRPRQAQEVSDALSRILPA